MSYPTEGVSAKLEVTKVVSPATVPSQLPRVSATVTAPGLSSMAQWAYSPGS